MPASIEQLFEALWTLADGPGATVRAVSEQSALMRLRYVVTRAQPGPGLQPTLHQVASICRDSIKQAATATGPPSEEVLPTQYDEAGAARALLGVEPGTGNMLVKDRRKIAADRMAGMQVGTLRKSRPGVRSHEQRMIRQVAEEMYARETDFVMRTSREMMAAGRPEGVALAETWLLRYEQYYRIWTQLDGLRAHVTTVLEASRNNERELEHEYAQYALHAYAKFSYELARFIDDCGGLWIFANADVGEAVAASVYLVAQVVSQLSHRQDSFLRLTSRKVEIHTFLRALERDPVGAPILAGWTEWLGSCGCDLESPNRSGCNVHRMLTACETYLELIEADWYLLADWYREPPKYRTVIDPAKLFRQLKLIAEAE